MAEIIAVEESSNPSTPATGKWKLFFKADGLYIMDDAGTVTGPFGAGGGVSDGDKGDITVSGSGGTWTIDAGVITLAKMADMATASLIGRNTGGTGVPEVLSAATVRSLLSLVIGTNVQAWDADLDYLASFTPSANVKSILNAADYAAIRSLLSLVIGTNVQAWDADLDTWAGKTAPSGTVVGTTDTQTLTNKTVTRPTTNNPAETHQTLTDGATVNWDTDAGASAQLTAGGNRTIAAPTNLRAGGRYALKYIQDGTGGRVPTWNAVFKNMGTVQLAASAVTYLEFWSDGTNLYCVNPLMIEWVTKLVSDPAGYYNNDRAQIPLFDSFRGALTIRAVRLRGNDSTPTTELAGDLKFADDIFTGSFAGATVIDVCDTTSGAFSVTSGFDDATVPTDKFIYFQLDAAPHADWEDVYIEVGYTRD